MKTVKMPYFFSDFTLRLEPHTEEWLDSALFDADTEARIIAAELSSPNDPGFEGLVERFYDELVERSYNVPF